MAKEVTAVASNGAPVAKKSAPRRANKPRTFYMVYKGELQGEPEFAFDRDQLIDKMLTDRELKVQKITVPVQRRSKRGEGNQPSVAGQVAAA